MVAGVGARVCGCGRKVMPSAAVICETEQNIFKPLPPPFRQIRRYVLNRVDAMVARSGEKRSTFCGGLATPDRPSLVPNAVDTEFVPADGSDRECREKLNVRSRRRFGPIRFVVGFVGRIVVLEKGITDLVEAIHRCPPNVVLLVVGSGACRKSDVRTGWSRRIGISGIV